MKSVKESWKRCFLETPDFHKTTSYKTLQALAKRAPDLTKKGMLSPERIAKMQMHGAEHTLVYAFQRVNEAILSALWALAKERKVLEQMECMQRGEPINWIEGFPSEQRKVLHTATRDIFGTKPLFAETIQEREETLKEHEKLKKFLKKIDKKYDEVVFIGIGGSELGPRALYNSLEFYHKPKKKAYFIGNVDPDDVSLVLQEIDLARALVVTISKSGTTLETSTNEEFIRDAYRKKGLKPEEHCISITMPDTPMDDPKKYRERFYLWDYVGGRYSSTSMVGGVLLSFAVGYDHFEELLRGAHEMDKIALQKKNNLPLLAALLGVWNRNFLACPTLAIIPYSCLLHRFPAHLQQCDMESNGKQIDRKGKCVPFSTGPIIWGEPGTNAQHSFFQLIHQGTDTVPLEIIGFKKMQGEMDFSFKETTSQDKLVSNMFAQAVALAQGQENDNPNKHFFGNRPSSLLLAKKLTPYTLGALLAFYEHKIAFQGFLWGINSFDQEGVQLGKQLADKMLALCVKGKKKEDFPLGKALFEIVK